MWHEGKLFWHFILCVLKSMKNDFLYPLEYYFFFSFISFERNVTVQMKIQIISNHTWKQSKIIFCFSLLFMISFSVPPTSWCMLFHFVFKETNKNKKINWTNVGCLVGLYPGRMDGFCVLCKKPDGQLGNVKDKGLYSLLQYSKDKQDHATLNYLRKKIKSGSKLTTQIHNECRKNYTNKRRLSQTKQVTRIWNRGKVVLVKLALINSAQTLKIGHSH